MRSSRNTAFAASTHRGSARSVAVRLVAAVMAVAPVVAGTASADDDIVFGRDVRPVLSDRCFQCHGPDGGTREADLRLDIFDGATAPRSRGRGPAVIPGDADASALWQRITSDDPDVTMPPPSAGKRPLSPDEFRAIRAWLESGAEYERHWAFAPPVAPEPPGPATPAPEVIDAFVGARIESAGLHAAPPAATHVALRRLFLDLTGLPPTPDELDTFAADVRRTELDVAWALWIDRLLTEEPYATRTAEHLTVPWLDAARYADTCGIHMDNGRQMWLWRDWVIDAFRSNMPYDQFVTDQLAGDLRPDATTDQIVASGFNRNHVTTDEGGAIPDEYLFEYAVDRVNTTATVFMGLTMGCARCHDHKFDPITMEDYYGLIAFFNSIEEPGLYTQTADTNRAYEPAMAVPTDEQDARRASIEADLNETLARLDAPLPGETEALSAFVTEARHDTGVRWSIPEVVAAASTDEGVSLALQEDGSLIATGAMPASEDYVVEMRTEASDLRLLMLEARSNPGGTNDGPGRASHGNAVVSRVVIEQRTADGDWRSIPLRWAWADHMQMNGDFHPLNVLRDDKRGWAMGSFSNGSPRTLLLLSDESFGASAGAPVELRVTLAFRSEYAQHALGHVRMQVSPMNEAGADRLPVAASRWYVTETFRAADPAESDDFDTVFGPEQVAAIDLGAPIGPDEKPWRFDPAYVDGAVVDLGSTVGVRYVGRTITAASARTLDVSLGSDDAFRLYLNGTEVAANRVDRGAAADQDRATLDLRRGPNTVVFKIVNTGGPTAFYFRADAPETLDGALALALVPEEDRSDEQRSSFRATWRRTTFPGFRAVEERRDELRGDLARLDAEVARTMIMKERPEPRPTFVMSRGQYDHADPSRPVERRVPSVLGSLAADAPRNRLGLAQWLTAPDHPLTARVAVNRIWSQFFGRGFVETSGDFGIQGAWPTHPELLDRLAVDFARDWDVHHLIRRIVSSATYRQDSRVRPEADAIDPENLLLWRYPARRLTAEQIRDLALYTSGLLVEAPGGPSVRPYQPEGLWREIAMPNSNTRIFQRDDGTALWRRTMYTYWKRAAPPPSLMTFDAPTRESCVVRRSITNTPLQALVLWNDQQFVEAARLLAERTLTGAGSDDDTAALSGMFRRCTGRVPDAGDLARLQAALEHYRDRYDDAPDDAAALLMVGEQPADADIEASELAAWTMMASAMLSLHETITQD